MLDEKTFDNFRNDLYNAVADAFYKYSDGNGSDPDEKDFDKAMAWIKRGFFDTYDNEEITSGCHGKSKDDKKKKPVKSSVDTSDGSFFCVSVPDSAYLQAGYLQFDGNDVWMVFQKRDEEGNIISEKEITENDLVPLNSLQSSREIKSDLSHYNEGDEYWEDGYFLRKDGVVYDKNGRHWDYRDYINTDDFEPYDSEEDAVSATYDTVKDSFTTDEIPNPLEYSSALVDFALKYLPEPDKYVKNSLQSSAIKSDFENEDFEDEDAYMKDLDERLRAQYAEENGLDLNEDMIDEKDYNEWVHRGAAMYSSVDRNRMSVKALYSSSPKKTIKSGREPYFYQMKNDPSTNTRLGEMNCTYNLPDEEINNLYGSWFEIYDDEDLSNPLYKDAKPLSELTEDDRIFVPGDDRYDFVPPSKYDYKGDVKFFG